MNIVQFIRATVYGLYVNMVKVRQICMVWPIRHGYVMMREYFRKVLQRDDSRQVRISCPELPQMADSGRKCCVRLVGVHRSTEALQLQIILLATDQSHGALGGIGQSCIWFLSQEIDTKIMAAVSHFFSDTDKVWNVAPSPIRSDRQTTTLTTGAPHSFTKGRGCGQH